MRGTEGMNRGGGEGQRNCKRIMFRVSGGSVILQHL